MHLIKKPNGAALLKFIRQVTLAIIAGGLLSIAFIDHDQFIWPWVAFVPMLFAIDRTGLLTTYFIGLIAGFTAYASGTYWVADFISLSKGYDRLSSLSIASLVWIYCAHQIAFLLVLLNWLRQRSEFHEFIIFPTLMVVFVSVYPMLFAMRLGESQLQFHSALQATELVGGHGLDAIIALTNILLFRILHRRLLGSHQDQTSLASHWLAISLIGFWFTYGIVSFATWEDKVSNWQALRIGIVQPNESPSLARKIQSLGYSDSYPPEMEMTERLSALDPDLVVWPEAQVKGYLDQANVKSAYAATIKALGVNLLFQDTQHIRSKLNGDIVTRYNSAILLSKSGEKIDSYRKMRHIPFGEYVPLFPPDSVLAKQAKIFLGDFLTEMSPGKEHKTLQHSAVNIVPLICYETTFPHFVAQAVSNAKFNGDPSLGSMLVGLSNDGWFGSSHQPYQHIKASVIRAVENRLPLVHVANNGPSIVVSPSGRTLFSSDFQRPGGYLTEVPFSASARGSFYSKYPHLFDYSVYALALLLMASALRQKRNLSSRTQ